MLVMCWRVLLVVCCCCAAAVFPARLAVAADSNASIEPFDTVPENEELFANACNLGKKENKPLFKEFSGDVFSSTVINGSSKSGTTRY